MPAAMDAISERLQADTAPFSAAVLLAPVLDPDGGVLDRLSQLLAEASLYAQRHGGASELWQNLARASQELSGWQRALATAADDFGRLPSHAGVQGRAPAKPALLPVESAAQPRPDERHR